LVCVVAFAGSGLAAPGRAAHFRRSGFAGSGVAWMVTETVPARVGRVAVVPHSGEAWAIGYSQAPMPGWDISGSGQIVFLRHRRGDAWEATGPPLTSQGRPFNPTLFAFDLASNGEGWAVGEDGLMLKKAPGSTAWLQVASPVRGEDLVSVSLTLDHGVAGFAVGTHSTILRYDGRAWHIEPPTPQMEAQSRPDLGSVATVDAGSAWAVSGSSSQDLRVYHRTGAAEAGTWETISPDASAQFPVFGGPHPAPAPNGGVNQAAYGASVAADAKGAWVGGTMLPSEGLHPAGDTLPGDGTRPFVIHFSPTGTPVSYCPDQYSLRKTAQGQRVDQTAMCDHPFPISSFGVTSLRIVGGAVFAGGLGLYHFREGDWFREPDSIGFIVSLALDSPHEGWFATTGNTFGAGGAIHASEPIVGHWTASPPAVRAARWPQPQMQPLFGIAVTPDGSGRAMAVGDEGAVVLYLPGAGWDSLARPTAEALLDVAWSDAKRAWAVGVQGVMAWYDGAVWSSLAEPDRITRSSLFGVAFKGPKEGVAVGAQGTILRYDGAWREDPASTHLTKQDLYDVAFTREGVVVVGDEGTILEDTGSGFRSVDAPRQTILKVSDEDLPPLYAVDALPDGTVVAAGARSALLRRDPGGAFRSFEPPVEGTILAARIARDAGNRLRVYASISPDDRKYSGDLPAATRASVVGFDGSHWTDLGLNRRRSMYPTLDSSAYLDPPFAIALDDDASGWAAGGFAPNTPDPEDHLRFDPTSSIYRIDTEGDPTPQSTSADASLPKNGVNFAFFAETSCGRGLCSIGMGSGMQSDLVAQQIQDEINRAARLPGGPRFVMFGGNGRAAGIPEELGQEGAFLKRFGLPVFGALGSRDLFAETQGTTVETTAGSSSSSVFLGSDHWQEEFAAGFASPWGQGAQASHIEPVECDGCADAVAGRARTHYAFDYAAGERKLVRIIVVDSSSRSYGLPVPTDQNPPERQDAWLSNVFADAKLQNNLRGVPTLVVMNQPTVLPDRTPQLNWTNGQGPTDATQFQSAMIANAVSAVITGGLRMAATGGYPDSNSPVVPLYVLGTGGAPLGYDQPSPSAPPPSKLPSDGFYNAWFLVHVDPSISPEGGLPGQVAVEVISFPVLESIAMHAPDGRSAAAGNILRVTALARALSGGFSDPEQSHTSYFPIGYSNAVECPTPGQGYGFCSSADAVKIPYRFYSEDPTIADFVAPDIGRGNGLPERVQGKIVHEKDGRSGLLCTFKAGSTYINAVAGLHRARMKITVGPGFGPCVDKPIPKPVVKGHEIHRPVPAPKEVVQERFFRVPVHQEVAVVFPPPPAPVVAPAPPGAPGVGRKEEHEYAPDTEGHDEARHKAVAHEFAAAPRKRAAPIDGALPLLGALALFAFLGASAAAAVRERVNPAARDAIAGTRRRGR
jgi:photosystem II stability/assembly factor-like uncharacterized protein